MPLTPRDSFESILDGEGIASEVFRWIPASFVDRRAECKQKNRRLTSKMVQHTIGKTEDEVLQAARNAISQCNWVVGECAATWTEKYAKGRTDADFGALVGLSADQVYQRRRVWETFSDVRESYPSLKWSHFYVALNWDDASECFTWAEENQAAVAEMKAWRRLQHGEDLTEEASWEELAIGQLPSEPALVRDPQASARDGSDTKGQGGAATSAAAVPAAARQTDDGGSSYAPFRKGAGSPAPQEESGDVAVSVRPRPTTDQLVKRMTSSVERYSRLLTPEFSEQFERLPEKMRVRFLAAVRDLSTRASKLR